MLAAGLRLVALDYLAAPTYQSTKEQAYLQKPLVAKFFIAKLAKGRSIRSTWHRTSVLLDRTGTAVTRSTVSQEQRCRRCRKKCAHRIRSVFGIVLTKKVIEEFGFVGYSGIAQRTAHGLNIRSAGYWVAIGRTIRRMAIRFDAGVGHRSRHWIGRVRWIGRIWNLKRERNFGFAMTWRTRLTRSIAR